jgi:PAS domain S-box-containing protein
VWQEAATVTSGPRSHSLVLSTFRRVAGASALMAICIGALVLLGWLANIDVLKSISPTWISMKSNTALVGWSLLVYRRRHAWLAQVPLMLVASLSLVSIAGYIYDVEDFKRIGPQFSAIHTAISFFILSSGVLLGRSHDGVMRLASDAGPGGLVLRRLLPTLIVTPLVLGWLIVSGTRHGLYETETGWALYCVATVVILTLAVSRNAQIIHRTDKALLEANATLRAAEEAIRTANLDLERRVAERTAQLDSANLKLSGALERMRQSEARLGREKELLRTVIDTLPDVVFVKDRESRFVLVNKAFAVLAGARDPQELIGKNDRDIAREEIARKNESDDRRVIDTAEILLNTEELSTFPDNSPRWMLTTKVPLKDGGGNVTGLGVLTGGIAHDFNNILEGILGNSDLAALDIPPGSPARRHLVEIGKAAHRGADLCRQMLAYAGKGRFQVTSLDLSEVIGEMRDMLELAVDDEESLRALGRTMLERLGFCVLTAAEGSEALDVYRAHRDDIVCVLLDLTMPKMDGVETFRQMRAINPEVVVLLSSGYNEQQAIRQFVGQGLSGLIQKPYQLATLERKLRELLENSG